MASHLSYLTSGQHLQTGEYLVSPNGLFFAQMQGDGNFCVYKGSPKDNKGGLWCYTNAPNPVGAYFATMQSDGNFCVYRGSPHDNRGGLWCYTDTATPGEHFFAALQDDGNFCVYRGTSPSDNQGGLWCTMATDPVVGVDITRIDYDVASAQMLTTGPLELYRQTAHNNSNETQTSMISASHAVTETSGWSDNLETHVNVSGSLRGGIPLIAEGEVTISADFKETYTRYESTNRSKTWTFSTPVKVPPQTTVASLVSVTVSTFVVPYTLVGTFTLNSGIKLAGSIRGLYTGTNSHDLTVTFVQQDVHTGEVISMSNKINPT